MSRFQVSTNDQWARVEPLLPSSDGQRGRPFRNHRQVVEGIAYRYGCGMAWRDLPEQFGPWQTVRKRHRRFAADGIWDRIHAVLLTQADAAGEIDWTVSVDSTINRPHRHGTNLPRNIEGCAELHSGPSLRREGRPLAFILGPGQGSDSRMFPHVIDAINVPRPGTGRARTRPDAVMGDKAYSPRANRSLLRARKIKAAIPEPRDQIANRKRKDARGGRPLAFDSEAYKHRSVVEQSFNIFKHWRGIATR